MKFSRWFDPLWLLALMIFVLAGIPAASFHGDEAMQVYMSHDYATAFIYGEPQRLTVSPPYGIDEDNWLRILNGSINRYAIGLSWQVTGFTNGDLPPRPGWDWGLDYARNIETNHRPPEALLNAARFSSTLFLALSIPAMFGLGWLFGGRPLAWFTSALYTLNPIILLNGRRAMMEGSMLLFGLLVVLIAAHIARKRASDQPVGWLFWLGLTLTAGLALASKHSGIIFVAGAFGWIILSEIASLISKRNNTQQGIKSLSVYGEGAKGVGQRPTEGSKAAPAHREGFKLAISTLAALAIFIALSPALWNDPLIRLGDLIEQRAGLLEIQVNSDPLAPTTLMQRIEGIITQPFLTPAAHYEVASWAGADPITAEINAYMASPISGLQFGLILGLPLTLLAGFGLLTLLWPRLQTPGKSALYLGLLAWVLVTIASLLINPLPWQRYYLPFLPTATLLAGLGFTSIIRLSQNRHHQPQSPLAG